MSLCVILVIACVEKRENSKYLESAPMSICEGEGRRGLPLMVELIVYSKARERSTFLSLGMSNTKGGL